MNETRAQAQSSRIEFGMALRVEPQNMAGWSDDRVRRFISGVTMALAAASEEAPELQVVTTARDR